MALSLEQVLAQLEAGKSLEALAAETRPAQEKALLQRLAVPSWFDRAMFDAVLRADATASFEEVVAWPMIERVAGSEDRHRLESGERGQRLVSWRAWPADFRSISAALARHLRARGLEGELEYLRHASMQAPRHMRAELERALCVALEKWDLPRLEDLLELVREQSLFLSELNALYARFAHEAAARGMWIDAWYRTARFHERSMFTEVFEQLFVKNTASVLCLQASGGLGKTSFLRWLIARKAIPLGIACAKIDFDVHDPVQLTASPAHLVLALATQLAPQLRGEALISVIDRAKDVIATGADPDLPIGMQRHHDVLQSFLNVINDHPSGVLIVVDTFEEAVRTGANIERLIESLSMISGVGLHDLRVVLAGRQLPLLPAMWKAIELEVTPFSIEEARAFLIERTAIEASLADRIASNLGRIAWKLALAADMIEAGDLRADQLAETSDLDVLWLTERVLMRIRKNQVGQKTIADVEVRWLLRYGAVPRRLTKELLRAVIAPFLPEAVAGTSAIDRAEGELVPGGVREELLFPTLPDPDRAPIDVEDLWKRLASYAGTYAAAWVWAANAETLVFQPEVSRPLRKILAKHEVHALLHRAFIAHFEARAAAAVEPAAWAEATCEAIFHRFQLEGRGAFVHWDARLEEAKARGREAHERVAREVTLEEYEPGTISPATISQGWLELAELEIRAAKLAQDEARDAAYDRARQHLAYSDRLSGEGGERAPVFLGPRREIARAQIAIHRRGDLASAVRALEHAVREIAGKNAELQFRAMVLIGDVHQRAREHAEACEAYRAALDFGGVERRSDVDAKLVVSLCELDRYEDALALARSGPNVSLLSKMLLRSGRPGEAFGRPSSWRTMVGVATALRDPRLASTLSIERRLSGADPLSDHTLGNLERSLMRFELAALRFSDARIGLAKTDPERAARCLADHIAMHGFETGDLKTAELLLMESSQLSIDRHSEAAVELAILGAALHGGSLEGLWSSRQPPRVHAKLAIALREFDALADALAKVQGVPARLELLEPLERLAPQEVTAQARSRLLELTELDAVTDLHPRDRTRLTYRRIELLRVLGRQPEARALLEGLLDPESRAFLLARERLGLPPQHIELREVEYPVDAVTYLEQAERFVARGDLDSARRYLSAASKLGAGISKWRARALIVEAEVDQAFGALQRAEDIYASLGDPRGASAARGPIEAVEQRSLEGPDEIVVAVEKSVEGLGHTIEPAALIGTLRDLLIARGARPGERVRFEPRDRGVSGAPWELADPTNEVLYRAHAQAFAPHQPVKWIQSALRELGYGLEVHGGFDDTTRAAVLDAFGVANFWPRLEARFKDQPESSSNALIVAPSDEARLWGRRADMPTVEVASFLMDAFRVLVHLGVDQIERGDFEELRTHPPAVIFVRGRMVASSDGGTTIDLAYNELIRRQTGRRNTKLSLHGLNRVLELFPPDQIRPTIILDTPPTGSPSEDMNQLYLRNELAASLFELGNTPAIIATGFYDPEQPALMEVIARALKERTTLKTLMRAVREHVNAGDPDNLPYRAPALFTYEPDLLAVFPYTRQR